MELNTILLIIAIVLLLIVVIQNVIKSKKNETEEMRDNISKMLRETREEISKNVGNTIVTTTKMQENTINNLTNSNNMKLDSIRDVIEKKLDSIQRNNDEKLEKMRVTVDEKLHNTLEQRLGESFKLVNDRLESVYKGLGEMQNLAQGVGDLKKVLTNVKARGTWGEVELGNILEEFLTKDQYLKSAKTRPNATEFVEFAIKLPGKGENEAVLLPVDSKFPIEDYKRLVDSEEIGDVTSINEARKNLENSVKLFAKDIHDKYLEVPYTTDFGIMFLPTESLYCEIVKNTALCETLTQKYRVVISGPTTFVALLNSLQMGFRTLAIEKRSSEVWKVLGAVKAEFVKFGELLDKTNKQLQAISNTMDKATAKTRTIGKKLKNVEALSSSDLDNPLYAIAGSEDSSEIYSLNNTETLNSSDDYDSSESDEVISNEELSVEDSEDNN